MRKLKEYKNLILSLCSLTATLLLLIVCVLGWYVVNKEASVNGVVGSTQANNDFTLAFEYYDGDSWEEVTNFDFEDMYPGDSIMFRLSVILNSAATTNISASFTGVSSQIHTLTVLDGYVAVGDVCLYEIDQNNKVMVDGTKTLYTISNAEVELAEYKIEDACKVYYIEKRVQSSDLDTVPTISNEALGKSMTAEFISSIEITESSNLYFAIRYEDLEDNNYYAYQTLIIDKLIVSPK